LAASGRRHGSSRKSGCSKQEVLRQQQQQEVLQPGKQQTKAGGGSRRLCKSSSNLGVQHATNTATTTANTLSLSRHSCSSDTASSVRCSKGVGTKA